MTKFITFGEINYSFLFILLMSISNTINVYIYGFTYIKCFHTMNIYQFLYSAIIDDKKEDFPHHRIFDPLFSYIGIIIMSFIIFRKKKDIGDNFINKLDTASSKTTINYYGSLYKTFEVKDNYLKTKKGLSFFILILIMWVAEENLLLIYVDIFQDLDFWFFESIFVSLIFSKVFSLKLLLHQKLGIAISIIVGSLLKIYNIHLSLNSSTFYAKYHPLISFCVVYFALLLMRSFVNTEIKYFLDLKYISHKTLLISYGIVGIIMCFLGGIISSSFPCSEEIKDFVCPMKYENNYYFDEYHVYFESGKNFLVRLIVIFLGIIPSFAYIFFYTLVIKFYTPVHVIFSVPIEYFIEKTFLLIFTGIFYSNDLFTEENQLEKFLLDESGDIASIIGFLINLEIIELNFCNLNYNLKKNIIKRGENDYLNSKNKDQIILLDIREEDEESNND